MKVRKQIQSFVLMALVLTGVQFSGLAWSQDNLSKDVRCTVCGMFVAKYPAWITKIVHKQGAELYFDGVKDMMVYFFHPEKYGAPPENPVMEVWLQDYYSLNWIDAKTAYFVIESDVYGPMGHEFIPFASKEAALSFSKDHHGKKILTFDQITENLVNSMRSGQRMK